MDSTRLVFLGPGQVAVESFDAGVAGPGPLSGRTLATAISAGTEGHLWKGTWPPQMSLDGSWNPEPGSADYPVRYGYAAVGEVDAVGAGLDPSWKGRRVFSFTGH